MIINPTPVLLDSLYWITLIAVIVSSASVVLKAGFMQFDLSGVIIIAIATLRVNANEHISTANA
jgi:hypothetical protein